MRFLSFLALIGFLSVQVASCRKQTNQNDAIRAAIVKHLSTVNGLNLDAMDMNIANVAITGEKARAQVEFHLKGNPSSDASMKISYDLEKRGAMWVVVRKPVPDGSRDNPAPGTAPPAVHPSIPDSPPGS
ncbi:MAG TPA: hypothetical protein VK525_11565 [Candidatus Saccharimonadales bacterium]|nr:hypothetical protein [Candidatus Saccharimonadales bacterium]